VEQNSKVKLTLNPDDGYRVKSVSVKGVGSSYNSSDKTVTVKMDTQVYVIFEKDTENPNQNPSQTTYAMSISSTGNGSVSYNGKSIRNTQKSFSVSSGKEVNISFSPDDGNRLKSVQVNGSYVSASSSCSFTVNSNTTVNVEFEAIPVKTYELSISVEEMA
jgi:hypothetical protein